MTIAQTQAPERQFSTGAVRDNADNKPPFYLLPYEGLAEVAQQFGDGAKRYAPRNWEKGIPLHVYIDSAFRHISKLASGRDDEDHARAACWNMLCYLATRARIEAGELPKELAVEPKGKSEEKPKRKPLIRRFVEDPGDEKAGIVWCYNTETGECYWSDRYPDKSSLTLSYAEAHYKELAPVEV